ncbi:hypothetical protein PIB30_053407 [Stylosanthes scabra]|uniref:Uncharacterized protein n=1 Tax=Stylosanthes scabra TaxID=79078 RepID=A0ABU6WKH4_9FABA|nr:hypothetical protein [Stylosanthes scabra]
MSLSSLSLLCKSRNTSLSTAAPLPAITVNSVTSSLFSLCPNRVFVFSAQCHQFCRVVASSSPRLTLVVKIGLALRLLRLWKTAAELALTYELLALTGLLDVMSQQTNLPTFDKETHSKCLKLTLDDENKNRPAKDPSAFKNRYAEDLFENL